ncbi:hypothetical protein HOY82DRAFT_646870 [Tuber indicum]|nr:hypothetical protein HOY82DRAFT_646870 [Tuber indicum]
MSLSPGCYRVNSVFPTGRAACRPAYRSSAGPWLAAPRDGPGRYKPNSISLRKSIRPDTRRSTSDLPANIATLVARYSSQVASDIFSQLLNSSSPLVTTFLVPEIAVHQLLDGAKRRCATILESLTTHNPFVSSGTRKPSAFSRPTGRSESSACNGGPESPDCPLYIELPGGNHCNTIYGDGPQFNPASYLFLLENEEGHSQEPLCSSRCSVNTLSVARYSEALESLRAAVIDRMGPELEHRQSVNTISVVAIADHNSINASNSLIPNRVTGLGGDRDFLAGSGDEAMKREGSNNQIRPAFSKCEPSATRFAQRNAHDGDGEGWEPPAKKAKGPQGRATPVRGGVDGGRD